MRKLLLLVIAGMVCSKIYFGSPIPPEAILHSPGFDLSRDKVETKSSTGDRTTTAASDKHRRLTEAHEPNKSHPFR
jgi:hypothetical protein